MKNIQKICLAGLFLLTGMISTAQVMTPEARNKMLARAAELEINLPAAATTLWPMGDVLPHTELFALGITKDNRQVQRH